MSKRDEMLKGYTQVGFWKYWLVPIFTTIISPFTHKIYLQASESLHTNKKLTYRHYYIKEIVL